ncbi:MAG TPA: NepR family anti-sigma factor [Sphingomonas sp.]|nr:NepR family anti-sigma factor [Sphingomonas sp.]
MSENQKKRRNEGSERIGEPAEKPAKRDIGHALRSVYARTVNEEIPSELLDLLGKLD